jgi:hypothetical protein
MINLVIAYSQQHKNACKMGDQETDHAYTMGKILFDILVQDKRLNVYLIPRQDTGDDKQNLRNSIKLSNDFIRPHYKLREPCFHIELHSDAGNYADGCSALFKSEAGKVLATYLYNELADLTPTTDAGIRKRTDLGALNQTLAVAVILEVSFHDDPVQAKWIHENPIPIDIRIANGWYKFLTANKLM